MKIDFTNYPICDTDVWVNICLGKVAEQVFVKYGKLVMADIVEDEILKWYANDKFTHIASDFDDYKKNGSIYVIDHLIDLTGEERKILEFALYELGFVNGFQTQQRNRGEYVSAIYADHFVSTFMASNDNEFQPGGKGNQDFDGLLVKNWNDVLRDIGISDVERIQLNKQVEVDRKRMDQHYENTREVRSLDAKLQSL
jgi:hypothetical protein